MHTYVLTKMLCGLTKLLSKEHGRSKDLTALSPSFSLHTPSGLCTRDEEANVSFSSHTLLSASSPRVLFLLLVTLSLYRCFQPTTPRMNLLQSKEEERDEE